MTLRRCFSSNTILIFDGYTNRRHGSHYLYISAKNIREYKKHLGTCTCLLLGCWHYWYRAISSNTKDKYNKKKIARKFESRNLPKYCLKHNRLYVNKCLHHKCRNRSENLAYLGQACVCSRMTGSRPSSGMPFDRLHEPWAHVTLVLSDITYNILHLSFSGQRH